MPVPINPWAGLRASLDALADAISSVRFDLPTPSQGGRRVERDGLVERCRRYLVPRLGDLEGPLRVAVIGSTGSGKSTMVNSLASREVSAAGPLRPTTEAAVAFQLTPDLVVIDTPDLDSVAEANRLAADDVIGSADAALFITTPQRYSDAVPWEVLETILRRGMPVVVVMNRMTRRSQGSATDLAARLRPRGVRLISVEEHRLRSGASYLPGAAVAPLRAALDSWSADHAAVARRNVEGSIGDVLERSRQMLVEVDAQREEAERLMRSVRAAIRDATSDLASAVKQGELVRKEVVARWQELAGGFDLMRWSPSARWARDPSTGPGRAEEEGAPSLRRLAVAEISAEVVRRAERMVRNMVLAFELDGAGRAILAARPDLTRPSDLLGERAVHELERWLGDLAATIGSQQPGRRRSARAVSASINAAAVATLLVVFAHTGGLTGAEVGVAAGAAALQQKLLEGMLGANTARRLATEAEANLVARLSPILELEGLLLIKSVEDLVESEPTVAALAEATALVQQAALRAPGQVGHR